MIWQCYWKPEQVSDLYPCSPYRGWGLTPATNPLLDGTILADSRTQLQLNEYGAMWYHWQHPELDNDNWIGFTSINQSKKFSYFFESREVIEAAFQKSDVVTWGWCTFTSPDGKPTPQMVISELCHPGITRVLMESLFRCGEMLPPGYCSGNQGIYCQYWAMSRKHFDEWMQWSWPLIEPLLSGNQPPHVVEFLETSGNYYDGRALGYLGERLFNCWAISRKLRIVIVGAPRDIITYNRFLYGTGATCDFSSVP